MQPVPRVVHITTVHKPTDNRIVRKECTSLVRAGYDLRLIAKAPADATCSGEVPLHPIPERNNRLTRSLLGSVDVWRSLLRLRPDVIHVHDPELIPLAVAWRWTHGSGAIYDSHEDLPKQIKGKVYIDRRLRGATTLLAKMLQWAADRLLTGIVVATPSIGENFFNPNTTLVQNYPWRDVYDEAYRPELPAVFTLGYVGAITRARGIDEMLRVARETNPPAQLLLAGPVAEQCQSSVETEAMSGSVRYLGVLDPSAVPDVLAQASVGLVLLHPLPNHLDSQPTKLYEYMAAGRPFIASNFPAWVEKFGQFDCGLFVDPADAQDVRRAVQSLIDNPAKAEAMGTRAREAVNENFVFDTQTGALAELTRRVARTSRVYRRRQKAAAR